MYNQTITWEWEPFVSVGPIQFNEPIAPLINQYKLQRKVEYDTPDWEAYEFPEDQTIVNVQEYCVVSVSCYSNFVYKGKNLLGLSLEEIREILGEEYKIDNSMEKQTSVEYDTISLQLWFEDGVTVSTMCYGFMD